MKKEDKTIKAHSRRGFINQGIQAGAAFLTGAKKIHPVETEKIKMLTSDGKLVEVDISKSVKMNSNTRNEDILNWVNTGNSE